MKVSTIYIRSLIGITAVAFIVGYGMYLGQLTTDVQLAGLAVIASCVLFDKPKIDNVQ